MISESTPRTFAGARRDRVRTEKALAHRVQRARADVAVHDADCGQGERKQPSRTRADGRQETSNPPTGLADGLEVGSPLPEGLSGCAPHRGSPVTPGGVFWHTWPGVPSQWHTAYDLSRIRAGLVSGGSLMNRSRRRFFGQCATVVSTSAVSAMVGRSRAAGRAGRAAAQLGRQLSLQHEPHDIGDLAGAGPGVREKARAVQGSRYAPLFQRHSRQCRPFPFAARDERCRRARSRGAEGHGGVGNQLRATVSVSR